MRQAGNIIVGLLCLLGLLVLIFGAVLLMKVVAETYAIAPTTTFKQEITPAPTYDGIKLDKNNNLIDSANVTTIKSVTVSTTKLPKANINLIQPSVPKEVWQNTARP